MAGIHGRSPLLRLQSDERLVALTRRGNHGAFETLVARYQSRLLAFCRHMLASREDAEDVLQEVFAASYNALLADEREINVRPWLYRIARNRCLNHLRRVQPVGVDSMDVHFHDHGRSAADEAHRREDFRHLIADVHELPETQRTALLLREMDALSYEQIAEAMETTIPSVKSLLVRARIGLAESAEARQLSCEDVRLELGEVAEGLVRRPSAAVRRHLRTCDRCQAFRGQLRDTNRALAAVMPIGLLLTIKKLAIAHLGLSWGAGSHAAGTTAAGGGAAAAGAAMGGAGIAGGGGIFSAGAVALAGKAAAGLAAAAIVTAGAVEVDHSGSAAHHAVQAPLTVRKVGTTTAVAAVPRTAVAGAETAAKRAARALAAKRHHKPAPKALAASAITAPATPATATPAPGAAATPATPAATTTTDHTQTIVATTELPAPPTADPGPSGPSDTAPPASQPSPAAGDPAPAPAAEPPAPTSDGGVAPATP
jgi:RNA polymerase sigma factor (sigma-70 family)